MVHILLFHATAAALVKSELIWKQGSEDTRATRVKLMKGHREAKSVH